MLVVGASASGVQIADELAAAGREVVLAVGRHTRMPREYRGMDTYWWLERTGRTARTIDQVSDPAAARRETSMQLIGRRGHHHQSATSTSARCRPGVSGSPVTSSVPTASGWASPTTWPTRSAKPTSRCTASSTPSTGTSSRAG